MNILAIHKRSKAYRSPLYEIQMSHLGGTQSQLWRLVGL